MSEPTSDGNQNPEPDQGRGDNQDQTSGSVFSDPTAPVWADPTAPIPASPAAEVPSSTPQDAPAGATRPPGCSGRGVQPVWPATGVGSAAEPAGRPTHEQPLCPAAPGAADGSARPADLGQAPPDPYGQPAGQYGQQYPTYGQSPYATGAVAPSNTSAIVLTIISGLFTVTTCVLGIPSLIFGIMALTSNSTDPVGSRKKAKTGWIIFAVNVGVVALVGIVAVIGLVAFSRNSTTNFDSGL